MNVRDYIESGILELYVAGALSPDELREVEAMASAHPEVRAEIEEIENAMTQLAAHQRRNPSPELRARLLDEIARSEKGATTAAETPRRGRARIIPVDFSYGGSAMRYSLAASIVITLGATILAVIFAMNWRQAEQELVEMRNARETLMAEAASLREDSEDAERDLSVLRNRDNSVVTMAGLEIAPDVRAVVYWNPSTKEVHLDPGSLPPAPSDNDYQLWALVDGKPVDAGIFKATESGLLTMKPMPAADAFAVTLEPAGGSTAPTLEQMYVMGKVEG